MSDPRPSDDLDRDSSELPPAERMRRLAELGQMTAEAVHDIRNPLAAIFGLAEILERRAAGGESAEIARRLKDNARHCRAIVDDLLALASGARPATQEIAIKSLAERILERHRDRRCPQGVSLEWRGVQAEESILRADPTSLERILENLITNAEGVLSEHGGGRIVVGLEADEEEGWYRIVVQDDGPGVPEEIRHRLFEPFSSLRAEGTGLGLAACRRLAEAMACEVRHEVPSEGGARFVLRIPGERSEPGAPASSTTPAAKVEPEGPLRILIVDDDRNALETYERLLALEGHHVEATTEGRQGLARFLESDFDVALVDIRIPDLPGPRFHAEVLQQTPERASRLVFATGDCHNPQTRAFLDATGNPYLVKPFEIDELRGALSLARRRAGQAENPPS